MNQKALALTFQQAVEGFLLNLHAEGYSQSTIDIYKWGLSKFATHVPDNIQDIEKEHLLIAFSTVRDKGLKPASIQNVWIAMRSFFNWAEKELSLKRVDKGIPLPKASEPIIKPLSEDEIKCLLSACNNTKRATPQNRKSFSMHRPTAKRDKAIILTLLDSGLRVSELARLTISDLDLETGQITVIPYGSGLKSKPRTVFIGKLSKSTLWRYLTGRNIESEDFVFTSKENRQMNRNTIRKLLVSLGNRAEIQHVYPHRFRHTFAIQYLRNSGDIYTLQRILGHSSLEMVKRYLAIAKADQRDLTPKYVPVLMIVQPNGFEKIGPGLKRVPGDDTQAHCAV
jgi:integrase/recombinase XerD